MQIEDLKSSISECYNIEFIDHHSDNLIITFTPTSSFFLSRNDLASKKLCVSTNKPNYYLYNPGYTCKKFAQFIIIQRIKRVIVIGSSKAGFAGLLWGKLLHDILKPRNIPVFILAFSPQTQLYPFNDVLGFPSYGKLLSAIKEDKDLEKCAKTYGNLEIIFHGSDAQGLLIYPKHNFCDRTEALKLAGTGIKLISIDSPIHGTIFPFMINTDNEQEVHKMVNKLYSRIDQDTDLKNTLPDDPKKLAEIISSIKAPSLKELCSAIFLLLGNKTELNILKQFHLF